MEELQNRGCFRLQNAFHDQLALAIHDRNRDRCLVNIHADILFLVHNGAPFGKCDPNNHNLPQSGRLFILRVIGIFRQMIVGHGFPSVAAAKRARSPTFQHWDPRGLFPRVFLRAGELSGAGDNAWPDSTLACGPRLLTRPRPKVHISENRVRADGARPALSYTISSDRRVVCRDILHASTPRSRLWSYLKGRTIVIPGGDEWNWAAVRIGGLRIHGDGLKRVR